MENLPATNPARAVLNRPRKYEADFSFKPPKAEGEEAGDAKTGEKRLLRKYFTPTEANWGPKARATGGKKAKTSTDETVMGKNE